MRAIFVLLVVAVFAFLGVSAQQPKKCGENEIYQRCGTGCERTCDNGDTWDKPCKAACVDKCFCKDGFLRNENGKCVRAWHCNPNL
ncbi:AGAP006253-PA [Anopheles gambiae str. PEST]|uniref:AGAP006253-PA n=3 Tax=gambiae species complex TaxID=44542 RepID=Q2EQ00_ANOGA|nr:chymotrypsin inhibitor [Anopheles gambiae]ABD18602.1 putative salivary secreted peptide with TIL domain [Anopheles gambiae]EAU76572.1 AGAP006253-PA [Anopheles gambiae str. PEST]